jgi:hypothetical protein
MQCYYTPRCTLPTVLRQMTAQSLPSARNGSLCYRIKFGLWQMVLSVPINGYNTSKTCPLVTLWFPYTQP